MLATLLSAAFLMGLLGTPHCLAMCGATCAALAGPRQEKSHLWALHAGRCLAYSVAGAVMAGAVGATALWAQWSPALRPVWVLLHLLIFGLGLAMLVTGSQPALLRSLAAGWQRGSAAPRLAGQPHVIQWTGFSATSDCQQRRPWAWWPKAAVGLGWVAWPCGLLQSALLTSSLAESPWQGAMVMLAFASATTLGLVAGPMVWARLCFSLSSLSLYVGARGASSSLETSAGAQALDARLLPWLIRASGLLLLLGAAWALAKGVWPHAPIFCG